MCHLISSYICISCKTINEFKIMNIFTNPPKSSQGFSFKQKSVIYALVSNGYGESICLSHAIESDFTQF